MLRTAPLYFFNFPRLSQPTAANSLYRIKSSAVAVSLPSRTIARLSFETHHTHSSTAYSNWEVGYGSDQGDREGARAI